MKASRTMILFVSSLLILSSVSFIASGTQTTETKRLELHSPDGVDYLLEMSMSDYTISLSIKNPGRRTYTAFSIWIDEQRLVAKSLNMESEGKRSYEFDGSKGIDVLADTHKVTLYSASKSKNFTFRREINESSTNTVPRAQIVNVSVVNGTWKGEQSAYIKVELVNPSIRGSGGFIIVHTSKTPGHEGVAVVPAESNKTVLVPLIEGPSERVAGEIRLFEGDSPDQYYGALDMVEFVGRPGGETTVWNKTYTTIRPPWVEDPYEYENRSLEGGLSIPIDVSADDVEQTIDPDSPPPILLGGLALVGLLLMRKLV